MKNSVIARGKLRTREVSLFFAGIAVAVAVTATAEYTNATQAQNPPCDLDRAAQDAVNKKIQVIGATTPDPGKYFNAGSPDSCLGNMSIANLDLSNLIPDPLGLLNVTVDQVINGLKKAAVAAACMAVRGSIGDTISKYNAVIRDTNSATDIKGQTNEYIDTTIADASRKVLNGHSMDWKTPQVPSAVPSGVQVPNVPVTVPAVPGVTLPPTGQSQSTGQQGTGTSNGGLGSTIFK